MRVTHVLSSLVLSLLCIGQMSAVLAQTPPTTLSDDTEEVAAALSKTAVSPAAPYYVSFQGYLEDDGSPADGSYSIEFRFMNQQTIGNALWSETQPTVQVTNGLYNVLLGTVSTLATEDFNDHMWLSIKVNGGNEILPRARIVGTPYSFLSFEALNLRIPVNIAGETNVQGNEMVKITQSGTGNVLEIDGGGAASSGIQVYGVDLTGISSGSNFSSAFSASGAVTGYSASGISGDAFAATSPGGNGIFVNGSGDFAFWFRDNPDTDSGSNLAAYVGLIENTGTSTSEDVLAIKTGTGGDPGVAANLIGFFDDEDDLIGQIEGNGSGGVAYNTTGADYAEYLPRLESGSSFAAGDIVGVFDGKISHRTQGATQIMAVTDRAAVLGNAPLGKDDAPDHEAISFIGQVFVRVEGSVAEGDYIVASGRNDGLGVAVGPEAITMDHVSQLVGRAWESSEGDGFHRVNVVVGLDRTEILETIIRRQAEQLEIQNEALEDLRDLLESHVREHAGS